MSSTTLNRPQRAQDRAGDAIEWEELPSFLGSLSERLKVLGERPTVAESANSGWDLTMPASLDELPLPSRDGSRGRVPGVDVRVLDQPRLFEHYFA